MFKFEANIITYQYPGMCQNILNQLKGVASFIRVWDNSPTQSRYEGADEIRWNRFNPCLSRVWNWAILQSDTEWVLVASDDIRLQEHWLRDLDKETSSHPGALWHGPSRFFFFNKKLIEKVGLFDERLLGNTYEDLDYVRRMNAAGVGKVYGGESSLNRNAASLKGEVLRPLHEHNNKEVIMLKYGNASSEQFVAGLRMSTPDFYPMRPR